MADLYLHDNKRTIFLGSNPPGEILEGPLPPGVWDLKQTPAGEFYLDRFNDRLPTPAVVYGKAKKYIDIVEKDRYKNPGFLAAMFVGAKGAGKTLAAFTIANNRIDQGIGCVRINQPYVSEDFKKFILRLGDVTLMYDEFEKTFHNPDKDGSADSNDSPQSRLLDMFNGAFTGNSLILMTSNDINDINQYMINRPGRIKYMFRHGKIDVETVEEYTSAKGVSPELRELILNYHGGQVNMSFDTLATLVNICGETLDVKDAAEFTDVVSMLNIPDAAAPTQTITSVLIQNKKTGKTIAFDPTDKDQKNLDNDTATLLSKLNHALHIEYTGDDSMRETADRDCRLSMYRRGVYNTESGEVELTADSVAFKDLLNSATMLFGFNSTEEFIEWEAANENRVGRIFGRMLDGTETTASEICMNIRTFGDTYRAGTYSQVQSDLGDVVVSFKVEPKYIMKSFTNHFADDKKAGGKGDYAF